MVWQPELTNTLWFSCKQVRTLFLFHAVVGFRQPRVEMTVLPMSHLENKDPSVLTFQHCLEIKLCLHFKQQDGGERKEKTHFFSI